MESDFETIGALTRFGKARDRLFRLIERALEIDSHCKSYEGRVVLDMPNYFQSIDSTRNQQRWNIAVACYVLGPTRSYTFVGNTLLEAVIKFEKAMDEWEKDLTDD